MTKQEIALELTKAIIEKISITLAVKESTQNIESTAKVIADAYNTILSQMND